VLDPGVEGYLPILHSGKDMFLFFEKTHHQLMRSSMVKHLMEKNALLSKCSMYSDKHFSKNMSIKGNFRK
jgi:hypothetical protein